jgi:DNA processing protein
VAFRKAVERHGSAAEAWSRLPPGRDRTSAMEDATALLSRAGAAGMRVLLFGEVDYPASLLDLTDPPSFLFALGDVTRLAGRRVGIVGTRHASASGERIAHRFAGECAAAGATIVSGMALGIDAAAHQGALDAGGTTVAVLGGGADLPYPPRHAALHGCITRDGLVLSEAAPGTRPVAGAFPRRNRIIAGLSDVLIVVEAGQRSGALITVNQALDLGRPIGAVPGPIDSPRHVGTNELLASGATFLASVDDVLQFAGLSSPATGRLRDRRADATDLDGSAVRESDALVLAAIRGGASDPDGIARVTGLPAREIAAALTSLELSGALRTDHTGTVLLG